MASDERRSGIVEKMKHSAGTAEEMKNPEAASTKTILISALRINEASNECGEESLAALSTQGETLRRSNSRVNDAQQLLVKSKKHLRDISHSICKEKFVKGAVLVLLVCLNLVVIYVRWLRK